jgi:hypothetical protein
VSPTESDELRMLRARAYGPDADIDADPAAQARLDELERMLRPPVAVPPPSVPAEASTSLDARPGRDLPGDVDPIVDLDESSEREEAPSPVWWRRPAVAWVGSLLAAATLGAVAAAGVAVTAQVIREPDMTLVATLAVDPGFSWPQFVDPASQSDGAAFEDFEGLTAVKLGSGQWWSEGDGPCLLLLQTEMLARNSNGYAGPVLSSCAAGEFPASIPYPVVETSPEALREEFGVGAALQFVLDGDRVGVFVPAR